MIIPVCPVPAPRMTQSDRWRARPCVTRYWAYRDELRKYIQEIPVPLKIHFCLPMPDAWSAKKKKLMNGSPHTQRGDIDNFLKGVLDILESDGHVHTVCASKSWAEKGCIIIDD